MKNLLIALIIVVAGTGAYYLVHKSEAEGYGPNGALEYVPADTAVFSGQLAPFPLKDYLHSLAASYPQSAPLPISSEDSPQKRFFFSLYNQYVALEKDPDALLAAFGLPNYEQAYFYTLGMVPVLKVQVTKPEALFSQLDLASQKSGLTAKMVDIGGYQYRSYPLDSGNSDLHMLVGEHLGWMTVTVSYKGEDKLVLEQSLGLKPVANNMTESPLLKDIVARHGFLRESVSFINHQAIAKALTEDKNELGKQLTALFADSGDNALAELRTPVCQKEINALAANWPMTVMGMKNMDITADHSDMDIQTIIESKNAKVMAALQSLRGFIDPAVEKFGDSVFTLGLGINTDNVASAMNTIWEQMTRPQFQCQVLASLQSELSQANPAMLSMASGMAQGAKGVSVVVSDYAMNQNGQLDNVDALVSVAVNDPKKLFSVASGFDPALAAIQLPEDGSAVDVSDALGVSPDLKVMMAIKGKHLVAYSGPKSEKLANELAKSNTLTGNGILSGSVDYKKFFGPFITMAESMGETIPSELADLKHANVQMHFGIDVNSKGLVFDTRMATQAPAQATAK
ncbi:hypothetical protein NFHSH190041_29720 [Shewanella sp. NFH-SH190041]|uniref:hypothetical protein n=1 Tax=Shewanella sp. NFH-SH190041 TaxID=2950245 RepID=UPI0021C476CF|nr:hypothetical protein [Shewanella sp. NFH-SH190041]BDM65520.1 hypothetical protein NFHSH190041_29720 [Shewanella sp. NFH-SH190041]